MSSNEYFPDLRLKIFRLLEADNPTPQAKAVRLSIAALIVVNVTAIFLQSHDDIALQYHALLNGINGVAVAIFTIEYLVRLWVAAKNPAYAGKPAWRAQLAYARSPMGLVDFLAIAPFLVGLLFGMDLKSFQALRFLRLLKLARYFTSLEMFFSVFRSQVPNLLGATFIVFILVIVSAMLMYTVEAGACNGNFDNATRAIWWAVVTLTSVGYGDVIPCTTVGKMLGGLIMLLGVGLVALPAAILAGKFADELQVRREEVTQLATRLLQDGILNADEQKVLTDRGLEEGFTEEEIEEFTKRARVSGEESRAESQDGTRICPRCGYSDGA